MKSEAVKSEIGTCCCKILIVLVMVSKQPPCVCTIKVTIYVPEVSNTCTGVEPLALSFLPDCGSPKNHLQLNTFPPDVKSLKVIGV